MKGLDRLFNDYLCRVDQVIEKLYEQELSAMIYSYKLSFKELDGAWTTVSMDNSAPTEMLSKFDSMMNTKIPGTGSFIGNVVDQIWRRENERIYFTG